MLPLRWLDTIVRLPRRRAHLPLSASTKHHNAIQLTYPSYPNKTPPVVQETRKLPPRSDDRTDALNVNKPQVSQISEASTRSYYDVSAAFSQGQILGALYSSFLPDAVRAAICSSRVVPKAQAVLIPRYRAY